MRAKVIKPLLDIFNYYSKGVNNLKASRGEMKICEILDRAGIEYREEYTYPDLKSSSGRLLRFDFAIFDDNGDLDFLIEFQGIQHYEAKSKFGGASGLSKQRYNDAKKRSYCLMHGLTLIAIPYFDEYRMNYDYIMRAAGY